MDSRARLLELLRAFSWREGDFVLASGKRSSFYVDVRRTSLHGEGAMLIGELLIDAIVARGWPARGVGGMAIGADPLGTAAAIAAFRRGLPISAFIVRKETKEHGTGRRVEPAGDLAPGSPVVVLDDTITTGMSTLASVDAMVAEGFSVSGVACVVDRGEGGAAALGARGIPLASLYTIDDLRSGSRERV